MKDVPAWLVDEGSTTEMRRMLSPDSPVDIETLAARARAITLRRFGRTMSLYAPLYLSNHCPSGCAYCGFASDRTTLRRRLEEDEIRREITAMKKLGIRDILLLTGERTVAAGFDYLRRAVEIAAEEMPRVSVETFPMSVEEYRELASCGCTGVTIYQETYDRKRYEELHRWGPKKDFLHRLDTPERALEAGIKTVGIGALLGLSEPVEEALHLYRHARHLAKTWWRAGISISFPRMRPEQGGWQPPFTVSDQQLARMILAFRIGLPDMDLALSTRERASFRDGMAGLAVTRMSIASKTTVGGYDEGETGERGQFDISDERSAPEFCQALRDRGIEPVFKNWDGAYNGPATQILPTGGLKETVLCP
ncbi:MAG: thiamine biosynthesis protein ThiH [Pelodictyon luteolum]|uniref:Thiamine biosynthesis protein ThiH n=1 Tax=Pelodictyon luteolum TaxID=1100 RepID=A0A165LHE6_PELLU|nr:2-iminoacetate synthase ThiH [Pelodictyon luteolum]KZK74046.1 MAG: thiamine biosynthesis protein ThiH [Pelodictyon luteolum]